MWPADLPQTSLLQGYDEQLGENIIRSQMDTGPAKVRRRFTKRIDRVTVAMALTATQHDSLLRFYTTTLVDGSLTFAWAHPRTGDAATFRFVAAPDFSRSGILWMTRCQLEVLP